MRINKDTKKYFSVAARPGNFGSAIYNELFRLRGINAVYIPLGVESGYSFDKIFYGLKGIGAQGINVSMPFKRAALNHCYNLPRESNINTLVRSEHGGFCGYNTDSYGFAQALGEVTPTFNFDSVFIYGDGALAHTMKETLLKYNSNIAITMSKVGPTGEDTFDWFCNATPSGMEGVTSKDWELLIWRFKYVFDAVISPPRQKTKLISTAEVCGKPYVAGQTMAKHGICKQFERHFPQQEAVEHLVKAEMKAMGYDV